MKRFHRTERSGDGVVSKQKQRADDGKQAMSPLTRGIDTAAVGIEPADLDVGPADGEAENAHGPDEPDAAGAGDEKRQSQDVKPAGPPIAEEQGGGLDPADVSWPFAGQQRQ